MLTEISNHIRRYVALAPEEEQLLLDYLKPVSLKRKAILLEPGKLCKGNYFVVSGCLRQYMVNKKLNEQIIYFGLENWWIADQGSLLHHKPATTYIQALEACELLLLEEQDRLTLSEKLPQIDTYFRIMMQKAFVAAQNRIGFIFNMTEEERYKHFAGLYPEFLQRVPQYMLASYLGFTPQFLSRLRAKKD